MSRSRFQRDRDLLKDIFIILNLNYVATEATSAW